MNRKSIHISIPTPCHELWDRMDATERGTFCHNCQKEVIDFSAMTDREVVEYLSKHKDGCGKFRNDQLNTTLTIPKIENGFLKWKALAFGFLSLLTFKGAFALRIKPHTIQMSKALGIADTITSFRPKEITISGIIRDSLTHSALPIVRTEIREKSVPIPTNIVNSEHPFPQVENISIEEDTNSVDEVAVKETGSSNNELPVPQVEYIYLYQNQSAHGMVNISSEKTKGFHFVDTSGAFSFQTDGLINGRPIVLVVDLEGYETKKIPIDPDKPMQYYTIDLVKSINGKNSFYFVLGHSDVIYK